MDSKLFNAIKGDLRKRSRWLPVNREVIKDSIVEVELPNGKIKKHYKCAACGYLAPRQKDIDIDHIEPVIPVTGFKSWDLLIERLMLAKKSDLQVLCKPCHKDKTKKETKARAAHKRAQKLKEVVSGLSESK